MPVFLKIFAKICNFLTPVLTPWMSPWPSSLCQSGFLSCYPSEGMSSLDPFSFSHLSPQPLLLSPQRKLGSTHSPSKRLSNISLSLPVIHPGVSRDLDTLRATKWGVLENWGRGLSPPPAGLRLVEPRLSIPWSPSLLAEAVGDPA
jgi:hypothetical protein